MSSPFKNIRVIFFDLDDTLWDHRRNQMTALAIVHQKLQLPGDFPAFHEVYHLENENAWAKYRLGVFSQEELRFERYYCTLLHFGLDNPSLAKEADRLYREIYPRQPHLQAGAKETLTILGKSYPLGLITNGFRTSQETKLETSGLGHYFRYLVFSETAGFTKPHPGIFHCALGLAHCQPGEALYIGDDPENDIEAAQALGWHTIFYTPQDIPAAFSTPPDASIHALEELVGLLTQNRGRKPE